MSWRGVPAAVGIMGMLVAVPQAVPAQVNVRLTGVVDSNVGLDRLQTGDRTFETFTFGSRYTPNLDGFIWNPRFLTFSAGGTFADQTTDLPEGTNDFRQVDPYRLRLNVFPQATHSFNVRASRSVSESAFTGGVTDFQTTTTTDSQGFTWSYQGGPVLPEAGLDLNRQTTETVGPDLLSDETRTSVGLRLRRSFPRATPTLNYVVEQLERSGSQPALGLDSEGISHRLQYEDRIRVGERGFLTPTVEYRLAESSQTANSVVTLAGPLSATLDGSTGLRYSFQDVEGSATQTATADGTLTKRLTPNLTLTGGVNGGLIDSAGLTWLGGGLAGLSATPFPHLRNAADYAFQLIGGEQPLSVTHRGHVGGSSTFFPRHTVSGDYFLNVFDRGGETDVFVSHSGILGVTSLAIPLTTLTGTATVELQEGDGRQDAETARLAASVAPLPLVTVRAATEVSTRSTSGGGREPTEETGYAVEAGADASPLYWLTLSVSARRSVRDVQREDKVGEFVSDAIAGSAALTFATLQFRAEGFSESEPIVEQTRLGVRGGVSYRFRIWTLGLEFERSSLTTAGSDTERERFFFRITRPLDYAYSRP